MYNKNTNCTVELVHAMPGQGVTSMFNFGKNFGFILGVLSACGLEPNLVSPQKWKRHFGLKADKKDSIEKCKELFPEVSLRRTSRCTTDSDGMAEALLIAEYGREMNERLLG